MKRESLLLTLFLLFLFLSNIKHLFISVEMEYITELSFNGQKTEDNPLTLFGSTVINNQQNQIPQEFVWPEDKKPSANVPILQIPLIDLAGVLSGDQFLVSEATRLVAEGAKQHGFFLVTNHGVDEGLMSSACTLMDSFFKSPTCEKQKAQRNHDESWGYTSSFVGKFKKNLPWKEMLSFRFSPQEKSENHSQIVKDFIIKKTGYGYNDFGYIKDTFFLFVFTTSFTFFMLCSDYYT